MPDFGSDINITGSGKITFSGSAGTTRQLLSSRGPSAQPVYQDDTTTFVLPLSAKTVDAAVATTVCAPFPMPWPGEVVSVRLNSETAVTTSAFIVDVKIGGTSIFSTRPQIGVGSTSMTITPVISTPSFVLDQILTVDITQASGGARNACISITVKRTG